MKFDDTSTDPIRFTRSVSEYARQMEELTVTRNRNPQPLGIKTYHQACERVRTLRQQVLNNRLTKTEKGLLLADLRQLENFWGLPSHNYNSDAFREAAENNA